MKQINYSFHIGERCQTYNFLSTNQLISGANPFSGTYISFDKAIDIINNNFENYINNIAYFIISSKKLINIVNKDKEYENIDKLIQNNKFYFFHKENYYKDKDYCISLNYTDLNNFNIDDMYYWNSYCIMPNVNYNTEEQINIFIRRKERFLNVLHNENEENILLIYQNKLIKYSELSNFIDNVIKKYNLKYNLFVIVPIYFNENDNENEKFDEKINYHENIIFYTIKFPDLEYQIKNNPNDDNPLSFKYQYDKIKQKLNELYDFKLTKF